MIKNSIVLVTGTRPEIIKMAPVYHALKKMNLPVVLCATQQHRILADDLYTLFDMVPEYKWDIMQSAQDLFHITHAVLSKARQTFEKIQPRLVIVQGDTTSAWASAQAAFYLKIPVMHVEAGLRTHDLQAPFPEEANRALISRIASFHCAPTKQAVHNLRAEGIAHDRICMVGNTIVDAVHDMRAKITEGQVQVSSWLIDMTVKHSKQGHAIMLCTMHRRESYEYATIIFDQIYNFLQDNPTVQCVYPYHPNPMIVSLLSRHPLASLSNFILSDPLAYPDMMYLLTHASLVATDSGGLQEEAITLGVPVIVLRHKTERQEGIAAGYAHWGMGEGIDLAQLIHQLIRSSTRGKDTDVYGDGKAAERIARVVADVMRVDHNQSAHKDDQLIVMPSQMIKKKLCAAHKKSVCIVGLGYIGLPTALIAAQSGFMVVGFDRDEQRISLLQEGIAPLREPELVERLKMALDGGTFLPVNVIEPADYFIIAVPTPVCEDKTADLSAVYSAIHHVSKVLAKGNVVILESTVPVDTTVAVAQTLQKLTGLKPGIDFFMAYCPERVLPGTIFKELVANDRIVGGINAESSQMARCFYDAFVKGSVYVTDATTAELVKLVENSSRDVQLAFANQVGSIAESLGINPYEVIDLANKHPRVEILKPTCGVGGHCIALDPWFLIQSFGEHTELLAKARAINDAKPQQVIDKIESVIARWKHEHTREPVIALMGLTYKPDVDDLRESPALQVARVVYKKYDQVVVCEPHSATRQIDMLFGCSGTAMADAVRMADVVVFLVAHTQFKLLSSSSLAQKVVIDTCGLFYEPFKSENSEDKSGFVPAKRDLLNQLAR